MSFTAKDVQELRKNTGCGIMDCKKALTECDGDASKAVDWLRKKGLATAAKKSGRVAAEGLIGVCVSENKGTLIEVNAETDFVAKNENFEKFVSDVVVLANEKEVDIDELLKLNYPGESDTISGKLTNLIAVIGENMKLRRVSTLRVEKGAVVPYIHNKTKENLGRIGVLVALESTGDKEKLCEVGKKIGMHIAAMSPKALNIEDLDPEIVKKEREIATEQSKGNAPNENVLGKMVEGRVRKFYSEVVLMEQVFVMDNKLKIKDVLKNAEKELSCEIKMTAFERFALGEGIEKQEADFANEVASLVK